MPVGAVGTQGVERDLGADAGGEGSEGLFGDEEVDGGQVGGDEGDAGFEHAPVEEGGDGFF